MKQLLIWLVDLITKLLSNSTKMQSQDPVPSLPVSQIQSTGSPVQIISQEASELITKQGAKLAVSFGLKFSEWSEADKDIAKRVVELNAINVNELNTKELLEYSELLDKVSAMSADQSRLLNEFKKEFLDTAEMVFTKTVEIGTKVAVGALIALI